MRPYFTPVLLFTPVPNTMRPWCPGLQGLEDPALQTLRQYRIHPQCRGRGALGTLSCWGVLQWLILRDDLKTSERCPIDDWAPIGLQTDSSSLQPAAKLGHVGGRRFATFKYINSLAVTRAWPKTPPRYSSPRVQRRVINRVDCLSLGFYIGLLSIVGSLWTCMCSLWRDVKRLLSVHELMLFLETNSTNWTVSRSGSERDQSLWQHQC